MTEENKPTRPLSFVSERANYHPDGPTRPLGHELGVLGKSLLATEEDLPELIHPELRIEALTGAMSVECSTFSGIRGAPSEQSTEGPTPSGRTPTEGPAPIAGVKPASRRNRLTARVPEQRPKARRGWRAAA